MRHTLAFLVAAWAGLAPAPPLHAAPAGPQEAIYSLEGNRLRLFDVDGLGAGPPREEVLVPSAGDDPVNGRDVNGMACRLPNGSRRFIVGEDTGQPTPPAGWGVFDPDGTQVGKLTATYFTAGAEPFGCAFDSQGRLFTTEVGSQGFGAGNGQLILWFPPYEQFPGPPGAYPATNDVSTNFCKIAIDLGTAGTVAIDANDNVYVAASGSFEVWKFAPPFPTGPDAAGGCGGVDALGSPVADSVDRSLFLGANLPLGLLTYSGLAFARNGNLYVSSVLTGTIAEVDLQGNFVRHMLLGDGPVPPHTFGTPQGLAVDSHGALYYADLDLVTSPDIGPGPDGKVRRIEVDAQGEPSPPETIKAGLAFPDGVSALPGNLGVEWPTYAGEPQRRFFNAEESVLGPDNVGDLAVRWRFPTGAIVTSSPVAVTLDVPGEGRVYAALFQSWDGNVYAVRLSDGRQIWSFATEFHPGGSFPNTATLHVEEVDGFQRVFVGSGEYIYALDAATGQQLWRFAVGTGCADAQGDPPGLCDFDGERNQIESSAAFVDGAVVFGMDVNDRAGGKGGLYAVDARTGSLAWFFDLESGSTCTPLPGDQIARFDGYHSEAELGLPAGFLATRPGCDFPRSPNGCGNVWSTPAVDYARESIFVASSNCDTDADAGTLEPPPPMPPYDEAIFALDFQGIPRWVWRPREVDNDDLAFGAAPNLTAIDVGGALRDVVGIGNKDGTYYVIDRDGVNELSGVAWDDLDPSGLPYWSTKLVPGGPAGGIVGTPAVDEDARRVYIATAPGFDPLAPQIPTVHALDLDSGAVVWDDLAQPPHEASFGPTSAIPGVAFVGSSAIPRLRAFQTAGDDGSLLRQVFLAPVPIGPAVATGAAVIDGTVLVGSGVGQRSTDPSGPFDPGDLADQNSRIPSDLVALCSPGTLGCAACNDGIDNDEDGAIDAGEDDGCVTAADPSEVKGDLDYNGRVDEADRYLFLNVAIGGVAGDPDFFDVADFDRNGIVRLDDYVVWLEALRAWVEGGPPQDHACGLLGIEAVVALAGIFALRRRRR